MTLRTAISAAAALGAASCATAPQMAASPACDVLRAAVGPDVLGPPTTLIVRDPETYVADDAGPAFPNLSQDELRDLAAVWPKRGQRLPALRCGGFAHSRHDAISYVTVPIFSASGRLAMVSTGAVGEMGTGETCVYRRDPAGRWTSVTCGYTWIT